MRLNAPAEARDWQAGLRRAAIALGLAAADRAGPGAEVRIMLDPLPGATRLTVVPDPAHPGRGTTEGPGLVLARHVVEAAGGSLAVSRPDAPDSLVAELPDAPAAEGAVAVRATVGGAVRPA